MFSMKINTKFTFPLAGPHEFSKPYSQRLLVIEMHFYAFRMPSMHKNLIYMSRIKSTIFTNFIPSKVFDVSMPNLVITV